MHEPDSPLTDLNQGILADRKCGEPDLWVDWCDNDFKDFGPVSAGADAGLVAFRWTGCEGSLGTEPLRLGARRVGPAPRPLSTVAWQGGGVATGRETTFPAPVGSERIGNPTQVLGKETGPMAERKQLIEDCLGTVVISRHQSNNGAEAGATESGWRLPEPPMCSGVTHRVVPTLPHLLLTAKVINAVAGRLLCSVQCPGHPESLACKAHSRSHRRDRPKGQLV